MYLVMEYCGGGDFHQLLKKRAPLPEDEARVLLRQIGACSPPHSSLLPG